MDGTYNKARPAPAARQARWARLGSGRQARQVLCCAGGRGLQQRVQFAHTHPAALCGREAMSPPGPARPCPELPMLLLQLPLKLLKAVLGGRSRRRRWPRVTEGARSRPAAAPAASGFASARAAAPAAAPGSQRPALPSARGSRAVAAEPRAAAGGALDVATCSFSCAPGGGGQRGTRHKATMAGVVSGAAAITATDVTATVR